MQAGADAWARKSGSSDRYQDVAADAAGDGRCGRLQCRHATGAPERSNRRKFEVRYPEIGDEILGDGRTRAHRNDDAVDVGGPKTGISGRDQRRLELELQAGLAGGAAGIGGLADPGNRRDIPDRHSHISGVSFTRACAHDPHRAKANCLSEILVLHVDKSTCCAENQTVLCGAAGTSRENML
jgi:hypothetical protein